MNHSLSLIPRPNRLESHSGRFLLDESTGIVACPGSERLAEVLQSTLRPATGFALRLEHEPSPNVIVLRFDHGLGGNETYRIEAGPDRIDLIGGGEAGLFYAIQTLRQLLPPAILRRAKVEGVEWAVPCVHIEDAPRFGWRGTMLDASRFFMPKEFILKFLDLMALHKLNVCHWHLTEDQGWRLAIQKYPKLTEVGSWRRESMLGHSNNGLYDGKPHGGCYTQEDVREIVAYARDRYITVLPEIEMPGHAQAAIASYPELGNKQEPLQVGTAWGVSENVYNVEESTIRFLQDVIDEVLELFPSEFIHIGGDECPKVQWKESPRAQELMKQRGLANEEELQSWFVRQMDTYLASKGRRLVGWDEILEGGLAPGATVMSWRGEEGGIAAAKAGHDVVMAPGSHTYFDHYQDKDRRREPVAIGGFTDIEKAYSYEPIPAELTPEEAHHVLGTQCQLWTEYMPNPKHVEYMAYPRTCAFAEVAWSPRQGKDFAEFMERLRPHLSRLEALDVNFRALEGPKMAMGPEKDVAW